ncbi:alkaline phosphatase family protein [Actinomadura hibisca]|uniref:alkaline phosphatase family protein n=1 Tax=Actinomadura hibisca TaxID=68565 RepID=UPI000832FC91|nr:alkaline phosphatase family protein [Actinomadura hibisca]
MTERPRDRVIVFGVDGVRYDTLLAARTPAIDTIAAEGFLAPVRVDDVAQPISGPGWTTVATGVPADRHLVYGNDLTGHRIHEHPDFLTRARTLLPGARTYAAGAWPQLVHETHGGPIFLGGGFLPGQAEDWNVLDGAVAEHACEALGGGDVAAAFVYFGLPDTIAHAEGPTPNYTAAVTTSDERIGRVLAAIRARPGFADERWTVIVTTDHGHGEDGRHDGDSDAERTAWIAATGPHVPRRAPSGLRQVDVHAHVLRALGITPRPEWALPGRPFTR